MERGSGKVLARILRWCLQVEVRIRLSGLLVAALYALTCWAARLISLDHFFLPAGVRIAALLLCPPRFWAYLLIGEYAYLAHLRIPMIDEYGATWVVLGSIFVFPTIALITHFHQRGNTTRIDLWLLSLAASSSISATAISLTLSSLLWPEEQHASAIAVKAARYIVGDFIGVLTLAPLALLWLRREMKDRMRARDLLPAAICIGAIVTTGVATMHLDEASSGIRASLQLAMFIPAIILTRIHGWQGAAMSIPVLGMMMALTIPNGSMGTRFEPDAFELQQSFAVIAISLLVLGSSISHYHHHYRLRDLFGKKSASLSRSFQLASEMDLRDRALHINRIGEGIDAHLSETADWLDRLGHHEVARTLISTSAMYSRKFRQQASMVYPTALEHVGLYLALQVGGISDAWSSTERIASPQLRGDPCRLSIALQLAAYRTLTEAVSLLMEREPGQIQIRVRCGCWNGRKGVLASVSILDPNHVLSETTERLAVERIAGRLLAYGGTVQCRRGRIRALLLEPNQDQESLSASSTDHTVPLSPA